MDTICIIIVVATLVMAVISIINIILKKDFNETFLGKTINKFLLQPKKSLATTETKTEEVTVENQSSKEEIMKETTTEETQNQE